jgi:uncharacterized protein involved in type VI secretion and phage assembly
VTTSTETRAPAAEISVGGSKLDPSMQNNLMEVRVEQALGLADRAFVRLVDSELKIVDASTFEIGADLRITMGAPDWTQLEQVFTGEIVAIEADIGGGGAAEMLVIAFDKSHRLRRNTKTKAFTQVTISDVASKIAADGGLTTGTIDATGPALDDILQHDESDWELLERLSNDAGCDIDVDGGKLQLLKRKAEGSAVTLTLGETLRSFRPRLSGIAQVDKVTVRAWNSGDKAAITSEATLEPSVSAQGSARSGAASALGGGTLVVVDRPADSTSHAEMLAKAAAGKLGASVIEATAVALGDPKIVVGATVELKGVGKRFGGEHRVVAATHVLRGGRGYETKFTVGAGGRPLVEELGGRARTGGFAAHLVIGLVTNNKDSENQGRIKVKYPALDESAESTWVRVSFPAAGSGRGVVALPQVNDEVVIGFEHGDIERPIVLGTLFNGKDKPGDTLLPAAAAEKASVGIVAQGDVVTTTDGNVKTTAKEGIQLSSTKDVSAQADGKVSLSATQALQLSSQAEAKMNGLTVTIQGQTEVQLTADAALQIKSNGEVQIQGSIINVSSNGPLILKGSPVLLG